MSKPDLAVLLKLKDIDSQRLAAQQDIAAIDAEIASIEQTLKSGSSDVAEVEKAIEQKRKNRDRMDLDAKTIESHVTKLKQQLLTVKTNREYEALRNEIGKQEAGKARIEDQVLQAMMDLDILSETLKRCKQTLASGHQDMEHTRVDAMARLEQLKSELALLDQKREVELKGLKPELAVMYKRLLTLRGDAAVAAVDVERMICQGCYGAITLQMVSMLMLGRDLVRCRSCDRYLYLPQEAREEDRSEAAVAEE